ncbi:flavin reductase family protein [Ralstonia insidiosa]|nr:flavin reductase family protein [Ralstonia insidiosa]
MNIVPQRFDERELRNVLGTFVTGVTVVTTRDEAGTPHGVTANSFSSVSLDPPPILWSQSLTSRSYPAFRESDHFVINILADDQVGLANHFAGKSEDKFHAIDHEDGLFGAPVLPGAAAWLECLKVAAYPGGDHTIYLGRVERFTNARRRPLVFGAGEYLMTSPHLFAA